MSEQIQSEQNVDATAELADANLEEVAGGCTPIIPIDVLIDVIRVLT